MEIIHRFYKLNIDDINLLYFCRILAELRHPHIVTYYDSFFEESSDFIFLCIVQVRARSQIPVVGPTGCTPGWPDALKLPGAAV